MRINKIEINNFRAINRLVLSDLSDAIVVAGPNGCGKSSIFDAIRLLKSACGGYFQNEYQHWFSEFQIDINRLQSDATRILFDPDRALLIRADFQISDQEREYLRQNAHELYRTLHWSQLLMRRDALEGTSISNPATKGDDSDVVDAEAKQRVDELLEVLDQPSHTAELSMEPGDDPRVTRSALLELMFVVYQPEHLGVIEYQSPARAYDREQLGQISLKLEDTANKQAQHALYNTRGKYTGIKTEMAQSFVREILAERAGVELDEESTIKNTLDELFANFFPGKTFLGAIPTRDGKLEFPVKLESGREHDINELSSGEKEVLLGYLRLRNSAPSNSILLLDEPELHLNPRLARSLPRFYERHLSKALGNQIWLVTHSDAILREAVQEPSYSVFHMQHAAQTPENGDQVDRIKAGADLESAIIGLVGDLASYNPRSKIVLLEGNGSEVDAKIITRLFPEFVDRVNLVPLGPKKHVRSAHILLEKAAMQGKLDARFYSIVDRDFGGEELVTEDRQHSWDVYHIENYLLEPEYIKEALSSTSLGEIALDREAILAELRECAVQTMDEIVCIRLREYVNSRLVRSLSLKFDQGLGNVEGFTEAASKSLEKLTKTVNEELTEKHITQIEQTITSELQQALGTDAWLKEFRGRNILRRFAGMHNISYELLRNLIVARMRERQYMPIGMGQIISGILNA